MHGLLSTRRGAALYLLVWLTLGVVFAALVVSAAGTGWADSLAFAIPATLIYGVASGYSAYYMCRSYPLAEKSLLQILLAFGFSALVAGVLWTGLCMLLNSLWYPIGAELPRALKSWVLALGVMLFCLSAFAHYLAIEFERARAAERRMMESRLSAQEAELRMLRTQIDPHFLFNSLNSISALTSQNPAGAREMTLQLAEFFRHTLGLEAHRMVTLAAEGQLVTRFLAIEKVRFGARLAVEIRIDDDARECLLPPMILQPLVENAVKHGIGALPEGGVVRVRAWRAGSLLHITVENDVDADAPAMPAPGRGIGLVNVRQRLAALFGHEAHVNWSRGDRTFQVALQLPAESPEPTRE